MNVRLHWIFVVFGTLLLPGCASAPTGGAGAETRLDQAALLAASCSGCHAPGGSAEGIASLDGMTAEALRARLMVYRNQQGGGSAMHRMARGYNEQQIAAIANYLGD